MRVELRRRPTANYTGLYGRHIPLFFYSKVGVWPVFSKLRVFIGQKSQINLAEKNMLKDNLSGGDMNLTVERKYVQSTCTTEAFVGCLLSCSVPQSGALPKPLSLCFVGAALPQTSHELAGYMGILCDITLLI